MENKGVGATHTSFCFRANPVEKVRDAFSDRSWRLRIASLEAFLQVLMTSIFTGGSFYISI